MLRNGSGLVCFLATAAYGVHLGNWQMRRKKEKEEFIAARTRSLASTPPLLDLSSTGLKSSIDQVVRANGTFEFEKQIFHGPRSSPSRQHSGEKPGFFVHTPLRLDCGKRVLVNCGWVPGVFAESAVVREPYFPSESVEVVGVVKKTAMKTPWFLPKESDPKRWVFLEMDRASKDLGVDSGGVIDALDIDPMARGSGSGEFSGPILKSRQTVTAVPITPTVHLIYAVTWYSLGIIGCSVAVSRFGKPFLEHVLRASSRARRSS